MEDVYDRVLYDDREMRWFYECVECPFITSSRVQVLVILRADKHEDHHEELNAFSLQ
jgi:hypothetical protein